MKAITLKGERVLLRPKIDTDAELMSLWLHDKEVAEFFAHEDFESSVSREKEFIEDVKEDDTLLDFSIINENGKFVGDIGAELDEFNKCGDMWIFIGDKSEWNKGYAQEAIKVFLDYFFNKLKYNRMEIQVTDVYEKAVKLYEKIGFKKEGLKREAEWNLFEKKFKNQIIMSILRSDEIN
jgi:RimJ/RimL family protein N-acetyltransferase